MKTVRRMLRRMNFELIDFNFSIGLLKEDEDESEGPREPAEPPVQDPAPTKPPMEDPPSEKAPEIEPPPPSEPGQPPPEIRDPPAGPPVITG